MNGKIEWDLKRFLKQSIYMESVTYDQIINEIENTGLEIENQSINPEMNTIVLDINGDLSQVIDHIEAGISSFFINHSKEIEESISPFASVGLSPRELVNYAIHNTRTIYNLVTAPLVTEEKEVYHISIFL